MEELENLWRERALRDAVLAGNTDAWKALYEGTFRSLYAYVHFRSRQAPGDVEDVVQEVWLTAVRRIRKFDPQRGRFEQWLRGIADNVLRNWRRKWRTRAAADRGLRVELTAGGAPRVESDEVEKVALTLTGLPVRYREVLEAKYHDGLPVVQIAGAWGETPKAVESLLSRARRAFREAYRHHENRTTDG